MHRFYRWTKNCCQFTNWVGDTLVLRFSYLHLNDTKTGTRMDWKSSKAQTWHLNFFPTVRPQKCHCTMRKKNQFWLKCFHPRFNSGCYHKYCPVDNTCIFRKTSIALFRRYNARAGWPLIENNLSLFNTQHVVHRIREKMGRVCLKRLPVRTLEAFVLQVFIWISCLNWILSLAQHKFIKTFHFWICHRSACFFWNQVKQFPEKIKVLV